MWSRRVRCYRPFAGTRAAAWASAPSWTLCIDTRPEASPVHLYGVTDGDDIRYVYSTFPIVERQEAQAHGSYRSRELCLAWVNALSAGNPDAEINMYV